MTDQPLSGKATVSALTDDDKLALIDAPGSSALVRLILATDARTYMQNGVQLTSQRGAANGYAPLDATSKVPSANLPTLASGVASVNGETGVLTNYQKTTGTGGKGLANGYAGLDGTGKVPTAQLPGTVQTASRNNNASVSSVVDFNYEQNVIVLNQNTTLTFSNLQPGAKTTAILVQDLTGFRLVSFPASDFVWDVIGAAQILPYPQNVTSIGFECREDGVTVIGYGNDVDRSEMWNVFTGNDVFSRQILALGGTGSGISNGTLKLTYFKPRRNLLVNTITTYCNAPWAATSTDQAGVLLATVDTSTWNITVAAASANTVTLWNSGNSTTAVANATALTSAYQMLAGRWYAFGAFWHGTGTITTTPGLVSTRQVFGSNVFAILPRMAGAVTGLTTLPTVGTSYTEGTQVVNSDTLYWATFT